VGREIERAGTIGGGRVARVTLEILRPIPIAPLTASAEVVRAGRTVELLEAVLADERGELVRARAWRVMTAPVDLSAAVVEEPPPPPGPDTVGSPQPFFPTGHERGYHAAMDVRFTRGAFLELGPATAWMRMRLPLVAGEQPSPLERVLIAADSGNGISGTLDYRTHLFVNTDLSVNLLRPPTGEWVCLDSKTLPERDGVGLADTALFDERGRIGRATQTLVIAARRTNG
jgi:Thioesterase-like superfamily